VFQGYLIYINCLDATLNRYKIKTIGIILWGIYCYIHIFNRRTKTGNGKLNYVFKKMISLNKYRIYMNEVVITCFKRYIQCMDLGILYNKT
jgi:hypothetical protein